jgi:hypothetical protein
MASPLLSDQVDFVLLQSPSLQTRHRQQTIPLFGLFGSGRSGTTWLGAILNSHPRVCYRFEPFHRLAIPLVRRLEEASDSKCITDDDLELIYRELLSPSPLTEKPPFFPKENVRCFGRGALWHGAKVCPPLRPFFSWFYRPHGRPPLVFKEVNYERVLARLLEQTSLRAVYLLRNPMGNVASMLRGQATNVMPTGRFSVLKNLLHEADLGLFNRFADRVDDMTITQKNALLWRIDVEQGVRAIQSGDQAMLVVYEELCRDPVAVSEKIFAHFGIDFPEQVKQFIEVSCDPKPGTRLSYAEWASNPYFSIFRDPVQAMNGWRRYLSPEQIDQILEVVSDCDVYRQLKSIGAWE